MHPAKSVIFFTTASGAGYGLVAWLGVLAAFGLLPAERGFAVAAFAIALGLITSGLLASVAHLGRPERAWRALSQWRSSWLSREGVAAIFAFMPICSFAACLGLFACNNTVAASLAVIAAIASLVTVFCTAMIYATLKAVPAWSNPWTPSAYLALSLSTGGLLTALLAGLWQFPNASDVALAAAGFVLIGLLIKVTYWRSIGVAAATSSAESATGLGRFGSVRLIDAPHSQSNYLLEEMGYQIARKHAKKLKYIAIVMGFVMPTLLLLAAGLTATLTVFSLIGAVVFGAVGVTIERWLFFAEARHVVMLYYGESRI